MSSTWRWRLAATTLLSAGVLSIIPAYSEAATVPADFTDQHIATLPRPVALAFTPDRRLLITTKLGFVRVYENGALEPQPALDLTAKTCSDNERGVLGVAVDPAFDSNHFIYVYYTFKKFGVCDQNTVNSPVNRVSRFVLGNDDSVDPAGEVVLIDNIPSRQGVHNAGDLKFGNDGYLYATTGDGGCDFRGDSGCFELNDAARDLGGLSGKVLRITRDGDIPSGNPFVGSNSDRCAMTGSTASNRKCREIYAWGLRNPFQIAHDPDQPARFFINDVGQATWEEIDLGGPFDYGWNVREGPCVRGSTTQCGMPPQGMTNPIYAYDHTGGCTAITLGAFAPASGWSPQYAGDYLFGDLICGKIFALRNQGGSYVASEFASGISSLISGVFGPIGSERALYYITWPGFPNDEVRRIVFSQGANRPPLARAIVNPAFGNLPLAVSFDATDSSDPDDDPLTFEWDFGDGSPSASGRQVSHTYTTRAARTATLTVRDGRGGEDQATFRIDAGNTPPMVQIDQPAPGQRFAVGETITLTGSASDPEDGTLSDQALSWRVERHHDTHTHPYLPPTQGNGLSVVGPEPEDLGAATTSFLEVYLTATDSSGLATTIRRDVNPRLVDLAFDTDPSGLQLELAGEQITTPRTVTSWEGWQLPARAFDQRGPSGGYWAFQSWSDGGTASHAIATPAQPAAYGARFVPYQYPRPASATPLRVPLVPAFAQCQSPDSVHVAPLSYASCSHPALESSLLKLSSAGPGAGSVKIQAIVGDPSTPADEADLRFTVSATDVRRASDSSDFVGQALLRTSMQITDFANGSFGDEPGTVATAEFSAPVDCVATSSRSVGASCALSTTADALAPDFAKEGKRTIISALSVGLLDRGADDTITPGSGTCPPTCGSGDERLVLTEGVFTP